MMKIIVVDLYDKSSCEVRVLGEISLKKWCQERDLNPRPPAYETSALTS